MEEEPFVPRRESVLRFLTSTTHANLLGQVHGGEVMKWIDEAAYTCAAGWCGCTCVTVYVGGIAFKKPIRIGDIVEVHARLVHTGTTSMHIAVNVRAGDPKDLKMVETTHCIIVFVGLDEDGRPAPVPRFVPETDEDRALEQYAIRMKQQSR